MVVNGVRFDELPVVHIQSTKNNTIMTVTDYTGIYSRHCTQFPLIWKVRELRKSGKVREFCWWLGKMACVGKNKNILEKVLL